MNDNTPGVKRCSSFSFLFASHYQTGTRSGLRWDHISIIIQRRTNPPINIASFDRAKMPRSVRTNKTLRCVDLFCLTGISMFIIIMFIMFIIILFIMFIIYINR
jgi:hypothetical protein